MAASAVQAAAPVTPAVAAVAKRLTVRPRKATLPSVRAPVWPLLRRRMACVPSAVTAYAPNAPAAASAGSMPQVSLSRSIRLPEMMGVISVQAVDRISASSAPMISSFTYFR